LVLKSVWERMRFGIKRRRLLKARYAIIIDFGINPGDGAFYGPKIDINFFDALDRTWQLGTIQCDFNLPERFQLRYIGSDNKEHRPVMLHHAVLGSLERVIGFYIGHCAGHFPVWPAPEQVRI